MAAISEKKLSLKLMVDVKAKKVVFAEADKEFVDFLFSLISLPLSSVITVLRDHNKSMVGCLGTLYSSIESLDARCFEKEINSRSVLKPRASVTVPLLSLHDCYVTSRAAVQGYCSCIADPKTYNPLYVDGPKYVNGGTVYMVTDNLDVKPMSIAVIKSMAKDFDVLEEKQVKVGLQEGVAILKASLETHTVLTTVFLDKF